MSMSLIETLPAEVFDEILGNCHPGMTYTLRYPPKKGDPVLVLSQVSHYWRSFLHDNALLWSRLSLHPSSNPTITSHDYLAGLAQWITRSCGLPLHLSTVLRTNSTKFNILEDIVKPYSRQIQHLTIALNTEELAEFFQLGAAFPRLKTLILVPSRVDHLSTVAPTTTFPALEHASFGIPVLSPNTLSTIPWNQLTSFRLNGDQKAEEYLRCLPLCTALRHHKLYLDRDTITALLIADAQSIALPNLESLEIESTEEITECDLMNPFFTPALEHLELILRRNFTFTAFTNLIVRSGCTLKSLWLHAISLSIHCDDLAAGFIHIPKLQRLVMGCMSNFPIHHLFTLFFPGRVTGPLLNIFSISHAILEARSRRAYAAEDILDPEIIVYGPSPVFTGKGEQRCIDNFRDQGLNISYPDEVDYSKYSSLCHTSTGRLYTAL
ncbi:hypothetical protein BDN72DRAFT_847747 [Pluteus cervinus]|uniref:Uncharacterized protein n=1 Tax=Pluteus cervinus TaxID=181527 RepID=A0ACD3ACB0_9AGAR|nr:hypothetical protein BDN72DRAFT_847747 [Pluteus cervinus]